MAGLVPAIHALAATQDVDARGNGVPVPRMMWKQIPAPNEASAPVI
jgi:hypothetical protein